MTLQRRNGLPYTTFTNILDFLTPPPHSEKCKYCFSATLLCFLTPSPPSVRTSHMEAPKWHFFEWPSVDVYPGVMALLAALGSPSCQKVSTTTVAGTIMSAGRGASAVRLYCQCQRLHECKHGLNGVNLYVTLLFFSRGAVTYFTMDNDQGDEPLNPHQRHT